MRHVSPILCGAVNRGLRHQQRQLHNRIEGLECPVLFPRFVPQDDNQDHR